ncbi:MAG: HlyD family efflux transporter periplasmic adaptor subunit [Dorea sp.]|nr:HlyD family efflux transporter periplasmic adaptor subunit [Dorea sp.]
MANKELTNIKVYQKKWHMNIGIAIYGVILIYLIVTVLLYLTGKHISAYEVREGSILKDNAYTGFGIRDEQIVKSDGSGYVNFFATEGSKVGAKSRVYSLSDKKLSFEETTKDTQTLTTEEQDLFVVKTQAFCENFNEQQFDDVYSLKDSISTVLDGKSSQSRQAQLDAMTAEGQEGLQIYNAESDGIIVYSTDGYENIDVTKVTEDMLNKKDYEKKSVKDNTKIQKGDTVYKLIKDDKWTVVILLNDENVKELSDVSSVKVRFSKDNETVTAGFSIQKYNGINLGILTINGSMVRYAQERYLDLELILQDVTGLKIPKSSVTTKDFYVVPQDYVTQGGNNKETGVLISKGEDNAEFQNVEIYYRDDESGTVYLDPNVFDKNTILRKPDSSDTFTLQEKKSLQGVYNINKGYAVFKLIKILCESDEYYIVQAGNDYGLANYDHIALVGKDVHENDVVY